MNYLPSKKLIKVFSIILLVSAGWILFSKIKNRDSSKPEIDTTYVAQIEKKENIPVDTDGDGLADWQESLWKTDINNSDSDNDGYSDGEEVSYGYGPSDYYSNLSTGKKEEKVVLQDLDFNQSEVNLTEELKVSVTSGISGIEGAEVLRNSVESGDESLLANLETKNSSKFLNSLDGHISFSELNISEDNSKEAVKQYVSDFVNALSGNPAPGQNGMKLFAEALQSNNTEEMYKYINYYEKMISRLKKVLIPSGFGDIHKREIELFISSKNSYGIIDQMESDPIKVLLAMDKLEEINSELFELDRDFTNKYNSYVN